MRPAPRRAALLAALAVIALAAPSAAAAATSDLSLTLTPSAASVARGQNVTYTVATANGGPDAATNAKISLSWDTTHLALVVGVISAPFSSCDVSQLAAGKLSCTAATYNTGGPATIVTLTLKGTLEGTGDVSATLSSDTPDPDAGDLAGSADTAITSLTPDVTTMAFPDTPLGTLSASRTLTLRNDWSGPIQITRLVPSGAAADDVFAVTDGCTGVSLAIAATCQVGFRMAPGATGARAATVTVTTDKNPTTEVTPPAIALAVNGTPFPPGPQGVQGPPGPRGPAGRTTTRLVLAAVDRRLAARRGRKVALRFVATTRATVTLRVRRGRRTVATVIKRARVGRNTISWNGRRGKRPAPAGRYTLALSAVDGSQRARASTPLTVRG